MTQSGIRYGQRTKQTRENDIDDKIRLCNYIRDRFGLQPRRDWYLLFDDGGRLVGIKNNVQKTDKANIRNPDILFLSPLGLIVVELDGEVHRYHGERTRRRNDLYTNAGIKWIALNLQKGDNVIGKFDDEFTRVFGDKVPLFKI